MGPLGFQIKCVPGYWELTCRNGDELEGVRGPTSERKAGCSTKICVVPRKEGRDEGGALAASLIERDEAEGLDMEESEELKFDRLHWPACLSLWLALWLLRKDAGGGAEILYQWGEG